MNSNDLFLDIQKFFTDAPVEYWVVFAVIILIGLILLLPIFLAIARGLSGLQIFGVFIATFLGFWILGLVLALVLKSED